MRWELPLGSGTSRWWLGQPTDGLTRVYVLLWSGTFQRGSYFWVIITAEAWSSLVIWAFTWTPDWVLPMMLLFIGLLKKNRQLRSWLVSVLTYRRYAPRANKKRCGLAGWTFLNRPEATMVVMGKFALWASYFPTLSWSITLVDMRMVFSSRTFVWGRRVWVFLLMGHSKERSARRSVEAIRVGRVWQRTLVLPLGEIVAELVCPSHLTWPTRVLDIPSSVVHRAWFVHP